MRALLRRTVAATALTAVLTTQIAMPASAESSLPPGIAPEELTPAAPFYPTGVFRVILGIGATESEATVSWRTSTTIPSAVELWRTDNPADTKVFPGTEQRGQASLYYSLETTLTDLEPGTTYSYRVGSERGGWSETYAFTTGNGDDTWEFLALADPQIGVNLKNAEQGATWRGAIGAATAAHPNAEMVLTLGDQVDGWGPSQPQYDEFFSPNQIRNYPTGVIAGNHETYAEGMRHFDEHFSLPNEVSQGNYFYERNNVLFISLNSNQSAPVDIVRHQEFLRDVVAKHGADKDWTVVNYHHGPFSQGSHTADPDVAALRDGLSPTLSELGVDAVLSGHDHIYTRSHLMSGTAPIANKIGAVGDRLKQQDGETLYITTTTAGGGKYYDFTDVNGVKHPGAQNDSIDPALWQPWTARWNQDYTPDYLAVSVTPTELKFRTVDVPTGKLIDEVTLVK